MEGFLSKKEKAAKADNRLMMKFGKQRWRVKLYLTDILELIINSLDQRSFPKHNLVMLKHQGILHTLFQTREEVDSVNEELFEEVFRDIAPVSEELPEDPFVEVHVFQGGSVVYIARSQKRRMTRRPQMHSTLFHIPASCGKTPLIISGLCTS